MEWKTTKGNGKNEPVSANLGKSGVTQSETHGKLKLCLISSKWTIFHLVKVLQSVCMCSADQY